VPGPAPKPASQRRRRNKYAGEATLPPHGPRDAAGNDIPAPHLPDLPWSTIVLTWWGDIWASPMATKWDRKTDLLPLIRLAALTESALAGETKGAAEARQLEDRYGLNALARRKLGWVIAEEEPDAKTDVDGAASNVLQLVQTSDRPDPRGALSAPGR
jgi:hypothetical protein